MAGLDRATPLVLRFYEWEFFGQWALHNYYLRDSG